ncbi:sucrase ferredoxin [Actinomycetota bacterium]
MDSAAWDERYAAGPQWSSAPNQWVSELCAGLEPGRALDLGAGEGRNAIWLAQGGWEVVAVDFSPVAVERIREAARELLDEDVLGRVDARVGNAVDLPDLDGSFDLVLLSYLHLPGQDMARVLTDAARRLAPGGRVVVIAHDRDNLEHGVGGPQDPEVLLPATRLGEMLAALGLVVELAQVRQRQVEGEGAPALDAVVLALQPALEEIAEETAHDSDFRCSLASLERHEPLMASAPHVRRWLLIEHPGPWEHEAIDTEPLPGELAQRIRECTDRRGGRVQLIRRPGRQPERAERLWAVVDPLERVTTWGVWREPGDLGAAVAAFDVETVVPTPAPPVAPEPLMLVCAHAKHDVCCATEGRPVAERLAERWRENVWQTTHLAGDRFAANLLLLPSGVVYGRLDAEGCTDIVDAHLGGAVVTTHLRGLSAHPKPVQAAMTAALAEHGPAPSAAVGLKEIRQTGDDEWTVELACAAPLPEHVEADVVRTEREADYLSCAAVRTKIAEDFTVTSLRTTADQP